MLRRADQTRRQLPLHRDLIQILAHQQAGARGRRERHRRQQLWIIAPAGALIGIGPAIVEDELAPAVTFHIQGHAARRRITIWVIQQQVHRPPARAAMHAAAFLQRQ